jgi:hypothetical protein
VSEWNKYADRLNRKKRAKNNWWEVGRNSMVGGGGGIKVDNSCVKIKLIVNLREIVEM